MKSVVQKQKRILAIHDISCVGRCSLTVAQPIISAAGIETSVIPTAILSTHTGGFVGYTYRDLTDDILPIVKHWQSLDIHFDAIYTGFLGSIRQIALIAEIISKLRTPTTQVIVDPVMADNGSLYSIFPSDYPTHMRKLVEIADVVIPNITEATLLTQEKYSPGPYSVDTINGIMQKLAALGPKSVVLTGVFFDNNRLGTASLASAEGKIDFTMKEYVPTSIHGTGDVFGSALVAALVHGFTLQKSCDVAADFTVDCIKRTFSAATDLRYGVNFEAGLHNFSKLFV